MVIGNLAYAIETKHTEQTGIGIYLSIPPTVIFFSLPGAVPTMARCRQHIHHLPGVRLGLACSHKAIVPATTGVDIEVPRNAAHG